MAVNVTTRCFLCGCDKAIGSPPQLTTEMMKAFLSYLVTSLAERGPKKMEAYLTFRPYDQARLWVLTVELHQC